MCSEWSSLSDTSLILSCGEKNRGHVKNGAAKEMTSLSFVEETLEQVDINFVLNDISNPKITRFVWVMTSYYTNSDSPPVVPQVQEEVNYKCMRSHCQLCIQILHKL